MTYAPVPEALLAQLESLAASRNLQSPAKVIRLADIEREGKKPRHPRDRPYWARDSE